MAVARAPLRLGLVGAGRIAATYAELLADLDEAELVAVVDVNPKAAAWLSERVGARHHRDVGELIDADLDGAIVCTPPSSHVELSSTLIARGCAVLCEKPFALSATAARDLVATAASHGVLLSMASKFRFVDGVREARELLRSGRIGDPVLFENVFAACVPMAGRWNADPEVSGGGVLIDDGSHSADLVRFLFGPVTEVGAVEGPRRQGLPVEDTVHLQLRTDQGVLGSVGLSWSARATREVYLEITGTGGSIEVGWNRSRVRTHPEHRWREFAGPYDKGRAIRAQVLDFCRAVATGAAAEVSGADAIASVEVIEAGYRALALGARQALTDASVPPVPERGDDVA